MTHDFTKGSLSWFRIEPIATRLVLTIGMGLSLYWWLLGAGATISIGAVLVTFLGAGILHWAARRQARKKWQAVLDAYAEREMALLADLRSRRFATSRGASTFVRH